MPTQYKSYLSKCACGGTTSRAYARSHNGKCKSCFTGIPVEPKFRQDSERGDWKTEHKRKYGRCEDAPCCGCCGPQGGNDYYEVSAMENAMDGIW